MPELPEVETIRRDLSEVILKKKITAVSTTGTKVMRSAPRVFSRALVGKQFTSIDRIGKLLIFTIGEKEQYLLVHLKMTGQLFYQHAKGLVAGGHSDSPQIGTLPNAHTRVIISFQDKSKLFFNDMRLFGYMELADEKRLIRIKERFGIEPLTKEFSLENFVAALGKRTTSIKAVLLNQTLIAGIGNIYADEACFAARIRPGRRARTLTLLEKKKLFIEIDRVLTLAIKERGTTFNTYIDGIGRTRNFLSFLQVYGRGKNPCLVCGAVLEKKKVAGRGTVYCLVCQK